MSKTIWVCKSCGSRDIEVKCWIGINSELPQWDLLVEDEDTYCNSCQQHKGIITEEEYEKEESKALEELLKMKKEDKLL